MVQFADGRSGWYGESEVRPVEAKDSKPVEKPKKTGPTKKAQVSASSDIATVENTTSPTAPAISEDVMKRAQELGMTGGLQNLLSRPDLVSKGLSPLDLLEALVKADGLVNKAKNALLSSDLTSNTPAKEARVDRLDDPISPEKVLRERQEKDDHEERAKTESTPGSNVSEAVC
jgi:hypothetical protein